MKTKQLFIFLLIFLLYSCNNRSSNNQTLGLVDSDSEMSLEEEIIPITRQEELAPGPPEEEMLVRDQESKTWQKSNKAANATSLFIGDNDELPLKGMQMAVSVDGFRARVLIDCFYYSDKEFELEGTFKMKLPQGATPYYFAFG
jgi:regulatory protein YycI of two-component signal transduction system YycFG